jgi:hypothetical protein
MKHKMYLLELLVCLGVLGALNGTALAKVQESVGKSLISNGGGACSSTNRQINGSLGQPVIGVVQRHPKHLEQGFWYAANRIHDANGWHTTVMMPELTGRNGQTITVPISMVSTQKMIVGGIRNWKARIRFNKSMLEPRGLAELEEADNYYIVTLSGTATDTIQQLASFDAFVRLGNDTTTALEFESFQWLEESRMRVYTESGSFTDLSICKAGGPRLTAVAGHPILRVTPQPVADQGEVICQFGQSEIIRVMIYDGDGTPLREIYSGPVAAGEFRLPFTTADLAAGAYVMSVRTEGQAVAEQFIIMR